MNRVANPVDAWVVADHLCVGCFQQLCNLDIVFLPQTRGVVVCDSLHVVFENLRESTLVRRDERTYDRLFLSNKDSIAYAQILNVV